MSDARSKAWAAVSRTAALSSASSPHSRTSRASETSSMSSTRWTGPPCDRKEPFAGLVPDHHIAQRGFQSGHVRRALEAKRQRHVVERADAFELLDEPQALLRRTTTGSFSLLRLKTIDRDRLRRTRESEAAGGRGGRGLPEERPLGPEAARATPSSAPLAALLHVHPALRGPRGDVGTRPKPWLVRMLRMCVSTSVPTHAAAPRSDDWSGHP